MWCIQCGKMVDVVEGLHFIRTTFVGHWIEKVWTVCTGPFAQCPPPPLLDNWEEFVQEPSEEEMELINSNANLM